MTKEDINECLIRLNELKENWDKNENNYHQLDANWVCVKFPKSVGWRTAKKMGGKKEHSYGWLLWSASTQDNGSNFAVEVFKIASDYGLLTRERQL